MPTTLIALAAAQDLTPTDGAAPEWVHLMPAGRVDGAPVQGKGPWTNDNPQAVVTASMASGGRPLPIDYDHAIDLTIGTGAPARAAGWITSMEARADGVWGKVEWTEAGGKAVAQKEWRFISPVFTYGRKDGEVIRILRASLTNNPAIPQLTALAAAGLSPNQGDDDVNEFLKALAAKLGLDDSADKDKVLAAVESLALAARNTLKLTVDQYKALASAAGLPESADPSKVADAVKALAAAGKAPDPAQFVPMAMYTELRDQVAALASASSQKSAADRVEKALAAGKLTPAQKDWALTLAAKDPGAFDAFVDKAPVVGVVLAASSSAGQPPKAGSPLSTEEKAVSAKLGISEEKFLKQRDEEKAQ